LKEEGDALFAQEMYTAGSLLAMQQQQQAAATTASSSSSNSHKNRCSYYS
jgi:hypothetical protein